MVEERLQKLAPGSRWNNDHNEVIDTFEGSVRAFRVDNGNELVEISPDINRATSAHVADVLAAIRRANLDQLAIVAKELVEAVDNRFIDDRGNDVIYWDDLKKYVEKLKELLT